MKMCRRCRARKPLGEFAKNRARADGLQAECRECLAAGRRVPGAAEHRDEQRRIRWQLDCTKCGARRGEPCLKGDGGRLDKEHAARYWREGKRVVFPENR